MATKTVNRISELDGNGNGNGHKVKAKPAPEPKALQIVIPEMNLIRTKITLVGDSPLVMHKWSEKARGMMLSKQTGEARQAREKKDPKQDYEDAIYYIRKAEKGKPAIYGFPAIAFKSAAVDACSHVAGITKVLARGAFHIPCELVTIEGTPEMVEHMVRVGMGTADIRFRPMFREWRTTFEIVINERVLTVAQIVNLFNTAGFAIGVGEHRPEKNGSWGMFSVRV